MEHCEVVFETEVGKEESYKGSLDEVRLSFDGVVEGVLDCEGERGYDVTRGLQS